MKKSQPHMPSANEVQAYVRKGRQLQAEAFAHSLANLRDRLLRK